ncbi:MAG: hypothetical protein NVS3B10_24790 [Polyangiales bacterium]
MVRVKNPDASFETLHVAVGLGPAPASGSMVPPLVLPPLVLPPLVLPPLVLPPLVLPPLVLPPLVLVPWAS